MPLRELEKLQSVNRFLKLEISREAELQKIAAQAAAICESAIAMITFMDADIQHVRFRVGTDLEQLAYNRSFCKQAVLQDDVFVVNDASQDEYFAQNPFVANEPHIRFYAGVPLVTGDGQKIGTVCAYDIQAKALNAIQQRMLKSLSRQVIHLLEFEASLQLMKEEYFKAKKTAVTLMSFFESSSSFHILLDRDMRIIAYNKAMDDFVFSARGKRLAENMPVVEFVHPDLRPAYEAACLKALSGETVHLERQLNYSSGRMSWYMTFEPALDRGLTIIGVSFNAVDITERVTQEERVKAQQEQLREIKIMEISALRAPVLEVIALMQEFNQEAGFNESEEGVLLEAAVAELKEKINKEAI